MRISDWSSDVCSSDLSISPVEGKYDTAIDRESAEELLAATAEQAQAAAIEAKAQVEADKQAAIAATAEANRQAAEDRERLRRGKAAARQAAKPPLPSPAARRVGQEGGINGGAR